MKINVPQHLFRKSWKWMSFVLAALLHFPAGAQEKTVGAVQSHSVFESPAFIVLVSIICLLMLVIFVFAHVAKVAIYVKREQESKKRTENQPVAKAVLLLILAGFPGLLFSQETATSTLAPTAYWGLDTTTFYMLLFIIGVQVFVAWQLYNVAMQQMGAHERKARIAAEKRAKALVVKRPSLIEKLNDSVSLEKESAILLDHDYDGIHELDNNLPPWWKYGFYLTILVALIYMFRYHVFHTGKLQLAEYDQQLLQAKYELAAYRKTAANLVDENNATLLTDGAAIASGQKIFQQNCVACHGNAGEGGVGPNLADDYWLHGGDVKDIFKTIKLGYPEKGMKSWQQDLGARQIHETASYILSLRGTNPPNAKEPQGELFTATPADTIQVASH